MIADHRSSLWIIGEEFDNFRGGLKEKIGKQANTINIWSNSIDIPEMPP